MVDLKEVIAKVRPKDYKGDDGKPKALASYKITYDSQSNQLEPVYYWILDFLQDAGISVEKITDNFTASPGSGQFSEMGNKVTAMQQQATKILADTNTLIKTILNLVYDLKEFEIRLEHYKKANSKDKSEREQGMLALKNVWLDQVDIKRGRGSIHQMAYEMGFTTLREAFLVANTVKDVEEMAKKDGVINDSVKRVLIPRLSEFLTWRDLSEKELKKRYEIEKSYLKSEVGSLKLYTQWARPYLKAAQELRMKGFDKNPALVAAFSTTMFELSLFGKKKTKGPPKNFEHYKMKRDYYSVYTISLKYRGHLGQRATQRGDYAYGFGGRVDIILDCYVLNSDELSLVEKEMKEADLADGFKLVEENTQVALDQLKEDIDRFTNDKETESDKKKKDDEKKKQDNTNPFSALFSGFSDLFKGSFEKKDEKKKEIEKVEDIKKDDFVEEIIREETKENTKNMLYTIYDVYKKAHGMASSPDKFEN